MSRHADGELGHHWMELISRVFFGGGRLEESLGSEGPQHLLSVLLLGIAVVRRLQQETFLTWALDQPLIWYFTFIPWAWRS